jgi:hypothetical protein
MGQAKLTANGWSGYRKALKNSQSDNSAKSRMTRLLKWAPSKASLKVLLIAEAESQTATNRPANFLTLCARPGARWLRSELIHPRGAFSFSTRHPSGLLA